MGRVAGPDAANPLCRLSLADLRRRGSLKWRRYPPDVLPLWVAELDVPLPEPVADALTEAIALGDTGYPVADGYVAALDAFARERWGWEGVTPELTALVPDVMLGIVEVLRLITGPGDAVVVNSPVYPPFYPFVTHADRRVVEAPLGADHRLDLAAVEAAFRDAIRGGRPAAYLLCSPHNPTGTVHTAAELAAVAALAAEYGVRVVADEIHAPLVLPGAVHVPFLSVPGAADAFSVMSASKGWSLAGFKAALAVAGPAAAADIRRMPEEVGHGASHSGVITHSAALRGGGAWLDALLAGLDANRRLLGDLLAAHLPEIGYRPPEGTFLAWLDCRALAGRPGFGPTPAAAFLERGRVALSAGEDFGTGGAGHARLNLATSPDVITEAVRRMAATREVGPG
ncbi:MAG TPA: aminotransferase class I/II-fold pyridoxal phosphate-dependent enzyme [Micromonosporaceae bacterium]|nr:aminotransferase class I/II-fold pyridoxal phosphate-dependent enzyme [Micromonosporaceae bacterium]